MSQRGNQLKIFSKPIPKMPEGYYSGDKPNPNLRAFVEAHLKERSYDPETYSWKVQFGESNFLWEAWLGLDTHWQDEEIIVNEVEARL